MFSFLIPPAVFQANFLRIYIEDRERYERHINPTFSSPANANRADLFTRFRIGADYTASKMWSGRLEYQNADDLFWSQKRNGSNDSSDLDLGYVKYQDQGFSAIGGRQKIILGQERLIGSTEWLNLSRAFDAARVQSGQWDAWGGAIGVANNEPRAARIGALTHTDKDWGTSSLIFKHDLGANANIDIQTLDHFAARRFGNTSVDVESALQTGSNNGRDQRAWAWHARVTQDLCAKTALSIEANAASGGGNSDTSRTFDNLYPSNHNQYGLADMTGWKNMSDLSIRLQHQPTKDLTLRATGLTFSLRDPADGWYGATGSLNLQPTGSFISATGTSGVGLGEELDLEAIYDAHKYGTLSLGIAFFEPGNYVKNLSGTTNQLMYGFIQYQIKF